MNVSSKLKNVVTFSACSKVWCLPEVMAVKCLRKSFQGIHRVEVLGKGSYMIQQRVETEEK